jgi:pimeloyl-ACP methyl ester carboxylesterase
MLSRRVWLTLAGGTLALVLTVLVLSEPTRRVLLHLQRGSAIATDRGPQPERLVIGTSPRLVADLYRAAPRPGRERPLIVLVHGSYAEGRRHLVPRTLGERLSREGFPVLALDLRGFGESESPPAPLAENLRFERDVREAARYALRTGIARPRRIVYVDHSLGAAVVLRAARLTPRPAAVVGLGTPAMREIFENGDADAWRRFAAERLLAMGHPVDTASVAAMERYLLELDPGIGPAVPSLLVFGEEELEGGAPPRWGTSYALRVIPGAGHAYTIVPGPFGLRFYDRRPVRALTGTIERWAQSFAS